MSYKNWEQILGVFKLRKQCYDGIFVNMHTLRDPWSDLLLSPTQVFFSFLFCVYHAGSRTHLSLFSSSSSFSSFLSFSCCFQGLVAIFFSIHFHWVFGLGFSFFFFFFPFFYVLFKLISGSGCIFFLFLFSKPFHLVSRLGFFFFSHWFSGFACIFFFSFIFTGFPFLFTLSPLLMLMLLLLLLWLWWVSEFLRSRTLSFVTMGFSGGCSSGCCDGWDFRSLSFVSLFFLVYWK